MIYLKHKGVLFLKPRKTAGTSLEIALSCHASDDDIVTPISIEDELVRLEAGGTLPCNWAGDPSREQAYREQVLRCRASGILPEQKLFSRDEARYFNHMPARRIRSTLGESTFDAAFKITMCRHPYDQVLSEAAFRAKRTPKRSMASLIDVVLERSVSNAAFYQIDGRFIADFVVRFEHLEEDLTGLEQRLGMSLNAHFPVTKRVQKPSQRPAAEVLSDAQKARCQQRDRLIFEYFDYAR